MNAGKTIKDFRLQANLTQTELAKATKLPQRTISAVEQDNANPTLYTLRTLADFYGITVDELIGHEVKKNF